MDTNEHTDSVVRRVQGHVSKQRLGVSTTEHTSLLEQEVEYELVGIRRVVQENLHQNWEVLFPQVPFSQEMLTAAVEEHINSIRAQVHQEVQQRLTQAAKTVQIHRWLFRKEVFAFYATVLLSPIIVLLSMGLLFAKTNWTPFLAIMLITVYIASLFYFGAKTFLFKK